MNAPVVVSLGRQLFSDPRHGPLMSLLLVLTVVTGLVDAVSILALGHVFVANMTGNVVFTGFGIAGAPGFSLGASLSALAGFLAGAASGGALIGRTRPDRARHLLGAVVAELVLMAIALAVLLPAGDFPEGAGLVVPAAVLALAMGIQNAVVRGLAVPDMTTTVLTMTLTGIAADLRGGHRTALTRRLLAVGAMLAGAIVGALLVQRASPAWALGLAVALVALVAAGTTAAARRPGEWRERPA